MYVYMYMCNMCYVHMVYPQTLVLSLLLSEDGFSVGRGAVDEMVAACEAGGFSPVDLDTLFRSKDQFCSVREFEDWVKLHPNLSSFTK